MSDDNISKIKDRLNVVDVISGYIKVQKAGVNFKARCPFHNEKTPSFYISPERQIWHCFGCQKGGDIFGFVKEIDGVEFPEALRILAQKAGVQLASFDPAVQDAKSALYEICETAARFFEKQLNHSPVGRKAFDYLKSRGLKDDTIKDFRLGFAPDDWHALGNFLRDCGYSDKDIIDAGLSLRRESGRDMYDRFRSRIIFPICDINDQIVGFTGRIFEIPDFNHLSANKNQAEPGAKYINSPQTMIYDKSRLLYGLNKSKQEARKADRCLLVEGNMDVIMSYQAGVKNVAATSGTALTPSHLQLLQRYTKNLDFCFDADQAGMAATRRGIGLALSQNFNIKIVPIDDPECKDPADYVKRFGQRWQDEIKKAKPVIDFYFDKLKAGLDLTSVDGKKAVIADLAPLIKRLASSVEKSHWIAKLATVLKTKEEAIEADIELVKDDLDIYETHQADQPVKQQLPPKLTTEDMLLEALLAVIIKKPSLFDQELDDIKISSAGSWGAAVLTELKKNIDGFNFNDLVKKFGEEEKMKLEFAYLKSQELLKDFSDEELRAEFDNIKNKIEHRDISAQLAGLQLDIRSAESEKDITKMKILLAKFGELSDKLIKIQK